MCVREDDIVIQNIKKISIYAKTKEEFLEKLKNVMEITGSDEVHWLC